MLCICDGYGQMTTWEKFQRFSKGEDRIGVIEHRDNPGPPISWTDRLSQGSKIKQFVQECEGNLSVLSSILTHWAKTGGTLGSLKMLCRLHPDL